MHGTAPAANRNDWNATAWAAAHVASSAAPAFVARGDGTIVTANTAAESMMRRGELPSKLQALVADVGLKNRAQTAKVSLPGQHDSGPRCFDLTLLPLPMGQVLVIGRDATFETNLISALNASRDLFRDLALSFTDFAFETDAGGAFSWASPAGLLGFTVGELHGARAGDLFGAAAAGPFSARAPISAREIWVKSKPGAEKCISLTASPVFDQGGGAWRGTRGVVRDVTGLKLLERDAAQGRKRDDLIGAVVGAVRAQIEPRRMMLAAADALAAATDSDSVNIHVRGPGMTVRVGHTESGLTHVIEVTTSYQGVPNGTLHLMREAAKCPFDEAARALIDEVAPHIGVALALVQSLEASRTTGRDSATGLPGRQAFLSAALRKHAAASRAGRELALFVIEGNDIGDLAGAPGPMGGETLAAVGRALASRCGEGDVAGVLEDGEFALLADDVAGPLATAQALRADLMAAVHHLRGGVSISIGCAVAAADGDETIEDLLARAECALHTAKHAEHGRVALVELNRGVTSC